eukprot:TRINITY_DN1626_c15_g1_i1.p1 TRINITY_DN1626_c15_g1~~TRINITY_DN1626_c15_g1_i1.p1  ORF type:complete len:692 (-),score=179.65 TRINITY_DN1626_c15_g1_i1:149-1999(-)
MATEESSRELMLLAKPLRLPRVPPVQGAGADGLPELPQVKSLVDSFLNEGNVVNTETKTFFGRTQMIQKEEIKKLERLKFAYDQKLKTQEKTSKALVKTNAGLAKEIMAQNKANRQIQVQLKRLDERITARRQQLHALEQRFSEGRQFMKSILAHSDDSREMSLVETSKGKNFLSKPSKVEKEAQLESQKQMAKEPELSDQQVETAAEDTQENQMSFIEVNSETRVVPGPASQASLMEGLAKLVNNQLKKTLQTKTKPSHKTKAGHHRALRHNKAMMQAHTQVQPHTQEPVPQNRREDQKDPVEMLDSITIPDFSAVEELAKVQPPVPKAEVQPAVPLAQAQATMPTAEMQPAAPKAQVQPPMPKAQAQPLTSETQQPPVPVVEPPTSMPEAQELPALPDFSAVEELAQEEDTPKPKAQVQPLVPKVQAQPPTPEVQQPPSPEAQMKPQAQQAKLQPAVQQAKVQPPVPEATPTEADVMKAKEDADTVADDKFISTLRDGLHALRAAAKKGEAVLKAKFQDGYMVGAVRQKALLQQQAVLKSSLNALKAKGVQLHHADAVLKERLVGLEKNLQQGGALLGGLAKVVTARIEDVPMTIEAQAAATAKIVGSTAESIP